MTCYPNDLAEAAVDFLALSEEQSEAIALYLICLWANL